MRAEIARKWFDTQLRAYRVQLRFCVRVTVAAISALLIAQFFALPLRGIWVVLTATVITQLSVGGSLGAGLEYLLGTLGGAVYGGFIGVLIPHKTELANIVVLALSVAPLAFLAALNPNFRVAPFSAVLVLLISDQLGEGPIQSAVTRLLEVALGGAVAVAVSLFVFPVRAHRLALEAAARVLDEMARDSPEILLGSFKGSSATDLQRIQDRIGSAVAELQSVVEEIERERPVAFTSAPDPGPLPRTLLRIRHDFVMIGRASSKSFPTRLAAELEPILNRLGQATSDYFRACALSLTRQDAAPPLGPLQATLDDCASGIAAARQSEAANLSASQLEYLFALGFALDQLQRNICDLERCIQDWVPGQSAKRQRASSRDAAKPEDSP
jgi:uncharacterized membrane protein YccC